MAVKGNGDRGNGSMAELVIENAGIYWGDIIVLMASIDKTCCLLNTA